MRDVCGWILLQTPQSSPLLLLKSLRAGGTLVWKKLGEDGKMHTAEPSEPGTVEMRGCDAGCECGGCEQGSRHLPHPRDCMLPALLAGTPHQRLLTTILSACNPSDLNGIGQDPVAAQEDSVAARQEAINKAADCNTRLAAVLTTIENSRTAHAEAEKRARPGHPVLAGTNLANFKRRWQEERAPPFVGLLDEFTVRLHVASRVR